MRLGLHQESGLGAAEVLLEAADLEADWVMAAIVGTAGLAPTLRAASRGADGRLGRLPRRQRAHALAVC